MMAAGFMWAVYMYIVYNTNVGPGSSTTHLNITLKRRLRYPVISFLKPSILFPLPHGSI
jgi:hypothetical protein